MKIAGYLATSAAQADSVFSTRDLDAIYSGFKPSFTRDVGVSNYYRTPVNLQQVAANANKSTCNWRAVKNDLNPLKVTYSVANNVESNYLASRSLQLVC